MSAAGVKTVFPLAVHLGEILDMREENQHFMESPFLSNLGGRGPQWDRQGKSFTKPFNLTLAAVFLTLDLYLLSHVERLGISEKVRSP